MPSTNVTLSVMFLGLQELGGVGLFHPATSSAKNRTDNKNAEYTRIFYDVISPRQRKSGV